MMAAIPAILALVASSALAQQHDHALPARPPVPAAVCGVQHDHGLGLCVGHGEITPDGPGYGWGFPNGSPDGYGWFDHGTTLPLGGNRVSEYYMNRHYAVPAPQCFFPTYYNPYVTRGQRYIPNVGGGGEHPAGGMPTGSSLLSMYPYQEFLRSQGPPTSVPRLNGRIEAAPIISGNSGLIP